MQSIFDACGTRMMGVEDAQAALPISSAIQIVIALTEYEWEYS